MPFWPLEAITCILKNGILQYRGGLPSYVWKVACQEYPKEPAIKAQNLGECSPYSNCIWLRQNHLCNGENGSEFLCFAFLHPFFLLYAPSPRKSS